MTREEVMEIMTALGFRIDVDAWDTQGWIRGELSPELDERDLRFIWNKRNTLFQNLTDATRIIFKAGQKRTALDIRKALGLDNSI